MVTTSRPPRRRHLESGFTLVEFMIAALITTVVLGGTVALATQIQQGYSTQLDDAALEQEARYALDWIARDLRSAASDPYDTIPEEQEIWLDPNGGVDTDDSIRVQADIAPPNGDPDDPGEKITIAIDPADADSVNRVITRQDPNDPDGPAAVAMTDAIFTDLQFMYLNSSGDETDNPKHVASVRVQVTARSRTISATGQYTTSTFATDVRLRAR